MRIDDKDDLKRQIRAVVRALPAYDVCTRLCAGEPEMGVCAMLAHLEPDLDADAAFKRLTVEGSPLSTGAQDLIAALDRLDMPLDDLQMIRLREDAMTRQTRLDRVRAEAGWAAALCPVTPETDAMPAAAFLLPALDLDACRAQPGRYGDGYAQAARALSDFVQARAIRDALMTRADEASLLGEWARYAALPLCEDARLSLSVGLTDAAALSALVRQMAAFPALRVAAFCLRAADEAALVRAAAQSQGRLLPCIRPQSIPDALECDRPRFLLYPSGAHVAELGIGHWRRLRAQAARTLYERYLPLLRGGFPLTGRSLARDVSRMMASGWAALHEENEEEREHAKSDFYD